MLVCVRRRVAGCVWIGGVTVEVANSHRCPAVLVVVVHTSNTSCDHNTGADSYIRTKVVDYAGTYKTNTGVEIVWRVARSCVHSPDNVVRIWQSKCQGARAASKVCALTLFVVVLPRAEKTDFVGGPNI